MKKLLIVLLIITAAAASSCEAQTTDDLIAKNQTLDSNKVVEPYDVHPKLDKIITKIIENAHYKKVELDDSLSVDVWENYIGSLDHNKLYFYKSDIQKFEQFKYSFDDNLSLGILSPAYDIFNIFKTRLSERIE